MLRGTYDVIADDGHQLIVVVRLPRAATQRDMARAAVAKSNAYERPKLPRLCPNCRRNWISGDEQCDCDEGQTSESR